MTATTTPASVVLTGSGRERGRAELARLVGDVDGFLAEVFTRRPLLRPAPGADPFTDLFGLPALLSTLRDRTLHVGASDLRVLRTDESGFAVVDPRRWTVPAHAAVGGRSDQVDPDAVLALVGEGASVALQLVDRYWPPLGRFCRDLELFLGQPCQATAYLTPPAAQGLDVHHDTHDVLILQLSGTKDFTLYEPVVLDPVDGLMLTDVEDPQLRVLARHHLTPGDVLYLPRGVPHAAVTSRDTSLHVTIGIRAPTWAGCVADIAADLARLGVQDRELRRALPVGAAYGDRGFDRAVEGLAEVLADWVRDRVRATVPSAPVAALLRSRNTDGAADDGGHRPDDPAAGCSTADVPVRLRRGALVQLAAHGDSTRVLLSGGRSLDTDPATAEALVALLGDRTGRPLRALAGRRTGPLAALVSTLLREGVLEVAAGRAEKED